MLIQTLEICLTCIASWQHNLDFPVFSLTKNAHYLSVIYWTLNNLFHTQHWRGGLARMRARKLRAIYLIVGNYKRYQRRKFVFQLCDKYKWVFPLNPSSSNTISPLWNTISKRSRSVLTAKISHTYLLWNMHRLGYHYFLELYVSKNNCAACAIKACFSLSSNGGFPCFANEENVESKIRIFTNNFLSLFVGTVNISGTLASLSPHPLLHFHVRNFPLTPRRSLTGKTKYCFKNMLREVHLLAQDSSE